MIQPHRHHTPGRALRHLLARLHNDLGAYMILIDEIGDCSFCWFIIADELTDMITAEITAQIREHPEMNLEGFVRWFAHRLAEQLDHDDDAARPARSAYTQPTSTSTAAHLLPPHQPPDRYTVALLAELAAQTPRLSGAKCVGRHQLYDSTATRCGNAIHQARAEALALCGSCPALTLCAAYVDSLPPRQRPHGVVAGRIIRARYD